MDSFIWNIFVTDTLVVGGGIYVGWMIGDVSSPKTNK